MGVITRLLRSSLRNEDLAGSSTDVLVNSLVEDAIESFPALFASHFSSLVSSLERRLFHRSVAHRVFALPLLRAILKISCESKSTPSGQQPFSVQAENVC